MVSVRKASKRLLSKLSTISKQRESDAYKRQLKRKNVDITNDAIRLSYGPEMGAVLNEGGVVTGGKVKLTHLHEQYPHQETRYIHHWLHAIQHSWLPLDHFPYIAAT